MISILLELTTEILFDGGECYDLNPLNVGKCLGRAFSQPGGLFKWGYRFFLLNRHSTMNYITDIILGNILFVDNIATLFCAVNAAG